MLIGLYSEIALSREEQWSCVFAGRAGATHAARHVHTLGNSIGRTVTKEGVCVPEI